MSGMTRRQLMEEFGDPGDDGTSANSMRRQRRLAEEREAQAQRELEDERHSQLATPGDAHREWHLNSGVPMGQPGCPQDACHPVDDVEPEDYFPDTVDSLIPGAVRCGNRKSPYPVPHYHFGAGLVRECYDGSKITGDYFSQEPAPRAAKAAREFVEPQPPVVEIPALPAETPAEMVIGARWSTIPVGNKGFGYYAVQEQDKVRFFRVERPTKGKWAGKTFIKEQASDTFYPVEPRQRGYSYLTEIASDPETAGRLYAEQLSQCTRCGRTLTDEESRERSMGPDCFKQTGGW